MSVRIDVSVEDTELTVSHSIPQTYYGDELVEEIRIALGRVSRALDLGLRVTDQHYPHAAGVLEARADQMGPEDWKEATRLREAADLLWPLEDRDD